MAHMHPRLRSFKTYTVKSPRAVPYLGNPIEDEQIGENGYIIRKHNRTIYPVFDRSVVVRLEDEEGRVGWGETYGLVAPKVIHDIIEDIVAPVVLSRHAGDVQVIWEDLYDLMRVRGYSGGYYLDALAAADIALWDLSARQLDTPLYRLLGGRRRECVPAYVSGLPGARLEDKIELGRSWLDRGFSAIKLHAVVSSGSLLHEVAELRSALGYGFDLMLDLHWMHDASTALQLIDRLKPYNISFIEAPCRPEDLDGLARVAKESHLPVAAGEEWRTVFDAHCRLREAPLSILQPEMGHTGLTQFMRMARLAEARHAHVVPHATIGMGIFMSASLHAAAHLQSASLHEYQPTIYDSCLELFDGLPKCHRGAYQASRGPGLGIEPTEKFWNLVEQESEFKN